MKSKEEILGQSFYPHECGSMIECVTKQDALKAMDEYIADKEKERLYWQQRCLAAENYIETSPCDPDIYPGQFEAYKIWQQFKQHQPIKKEEI